MLAVVDDPFPAAYTIHDGLFGYRLPECKSILCTTGHLPTLARRRIQNQRIQIAVAFSIRPLGIRLLLD